MSVYGGHDPRDVPTYGVGDAARYLGVPPSTLRYWVAGGRRGERRYEPILETPPADSGLLSFTNLVEAHVLSAIRYRYGISLEKTRRAVEYVSELVGGRHPLAHQEFATDGLSLFVERWGQLINATEHGQLAIQEALRAHLERIERDEQGLAARLYLFTSPPRLSAAPGVRLEEQPRIVVVDPRISFGRPVLRGTGIPTAVLAARFKAGETIRHLAEDYGQPFGDIEAAIRCELPAREAA